MSKYGLYNTEKLSARKGLLEALFLLVVFGIKFLFLQFCNAKENKIEGVLFVLLVYIFTELEVEVEIWQVH